MKFKANVYAPLFFGVILLLVGLSSSIVSLIRRISEDAFLSNTIVQFLVYLLPLAFYCQVRSINPISSLKFRYVSPKKIPLLLVLSLIFFVGGMILRYFGLFYLNSAFVETPSSVFIPTEGKEGFLVFLCQIILPAILEECVFRGILLEEYRSYGIPWALGITSLMFAMVHISFENFFYYLFMGLMLGLVAVVSDSITASVILHIGINYSYFHFRPNIVEYLRQAGKSPLLPYLMVACFILLVVFLFSRLETVYQNKAYDELLESRKELLRREVEKTRESQEQKEPLAEKASPVAWKEIFLSPSFLVTAALFIGFSFGIFS